MATESFIVTALPHSVAEDADVHVAVFIAPEIVPDAPGQELGELTLFPDWAATVVDDTRIELFDQAGTIECTAHLDRIHPKEWPAVFPPDTPVLNRREPDLAERRWRTFRPAYLHDAAKFLHAAAMFSDPTSPPLPSRHPLTEPLVSYLRQHEVLRERYDESQVTRAARSGHRRVQGLRPDVARTRASTRRDGRARPLRPRAASRPAVLRAAGVGLPVPGPADRRGGHAEAGRRRSPTSTSGWRRWGTTPRCCAGWGSSSS